MGGSDANWVPVTPGKGNVEAGFCSQKSPGHLSATSGTRRTPGSSGKRAKIKKHRPKVLDNKPKKQPKPARTPRPRTPGHAIHKPNQAHTNKKRKTKCIEDVTNQKRKRKCDEDFEMNDDVVRGTTNKTMEYTSPSCKKKLDFNLENRHDGFLMIADPGSYFGAEKCVLGRPKILITYQRRFWPKDCLKNSRRMGPNFPTLFKRARSIHKKRTNLCNFDFSDYPTNYRCVSQLPRMVKTRKKRPIRKVNKLRLNLLNIPRKTRSKMRNRRKNFNSFGRMIQNITDSHRHVQQLANLNFTEHQEEKGLAARSNSTEDQVELEVVDSCVNIKGRHTSSLKLIVREFPPNLERDYVLTSRDDTKFIGALMNNVIVRLKSLSVGVDVVDHPSKSATYREKSTIKPKKAKKEKKAKILIDFDIETLEGWERKKNGAWNWNERLIEDENRSTWTETKLLEGCEKNSTEMKLLEGCEKNSTEIKLLEGCEHNSTEIKLLEGCEHTSTELKLLEECADTGGNAKAEYWKREREVFKGRLILFLARMRYLQGDVSFDHWKGSVVDSIVGVYLTQNVTDNLSSSAFLSLAAKYPPPRESVRTHARRDEAIPCLTEERTRIDAPELGDSTVINGDRPLQEGSYDQILKSSANEINGDRPLQEGSYDQILKSSANEMPLGLSEDEFNKGRDNSFQSPVKTSSHNESTPKEKKEKLKDMEENNRIDWAELRRTYKLHPDIELNDSADWEAVRQAPVEEIAKAIAGRGMNNILAKKIKDFLNDVSENLGTIDLEWLRYVPPDIAQDILLKIPGIGLKSTECVRLLGLKMHAFPVDVNVARIFVRLGWVPLKPLPDNLPFHLLNSYPDLDSIQKYIWPRICKFSPLILYAVHYYLITFGKIMCRKRSPNCEACPMKLDCKHYQSKQASYNHLLTGPEGVYHTTPNSSEPFTPSPLPHLPESGEEYQTMANGFEPIIEFPSSPGAEIDMEDFASNQNMEDFASNHKKDFTDLFSLPFGFDSNLATALITMPEPITMPELKKKKELCTSHPVLVLPDDHPLIAGFEQRVYYETNPYLLRVWTKGDWRANQSQQKCHNSTLTTLCDSGVNDGYQSQQERHHGTLTATASCDSCASDGFESQITGTNDRTVQGTILIPCRTANRGSFPLNGTYYQGNEVFADHETSEKPIQIPIKLLQGLEERTLYCATGLSSIHKDMSFIQMRKSYQGYFCVRNFDRATREAKTLDNKFYARGYVDKTKKGHSKKLA